MIQLSDLATVMKDTAITLYIDNEYIANVRYGQDLDNINNCVVTKIEYLNCDVIAVYALRYEHGIQGS